MAKKVEAEVKAEGVSKPYELMLILNPDLRESEVTKKLKEIEGMAEKAGGKITENDFWGKKRLAYRIKKYDEGIYAVYNFSMQGSFVKELKEFLRLEKSVLRYMLISLPGDYAYTRYDFKEIEDQPIKKMAEKNMSAKKKVQVFVKKEKTDHSAKESDAPKDKSGDEEKAREAELDRKLDEILGGEDIKL